MSDSEGSEINSSNKRKKGVRHAYLYKSNAIKRAKVKGECHINHAGNVVDARKTGPECR